MVFHWKIKEFLALLRIEEIRARWSDLFLVFIFCLNSYLFHVFTPSVSSSIWFLTNATSSAIIALGLAGVLFYDDSVLPVTAVNMKWCLRRLKIIRS